MLSSIIFTIVFIVLNHCVLNDVSSYQLEQNTRTLFLGHSHIECGYNDSIIPQSLNLGQSGESYFYTYLKLKSILEYNSQIEQVFVEFTNNQLLKDKDDWTWDKSHLARSFPTLSPICSFQDHLNILSNSPINYIYALHKTFSHNIKRLTLKSFFYQITNSGGYTSSDKIIDKDIDLPSIKNELKQYSEINIDYLEKITELCQKRKVHLTFLRSPLYVSNKQLKNEQLFQEIRENRFNDIEFVDLKDFLQDPKYFQDYGHLNSEGATLISAYLAKNN